MKNIYLFEASILFFLTGCSSTYKVTDFPSKEKFYEAFNYTFKEKEVKITLTNDSILTTSDGVEIENDTLFSYMKMEEMSDERFALSEIEEIVYLGKSSLTAKILLKNGVEFKANDIKVNHDSLQCVSFKSRLRRVDLVPIENVRTTSYKNRWKAFNQGGIAGAMTGGVIGLFGYQDDSESHSEPNGVSDTDRKPPSYETCLFGPVVRFIKGSLIGYAAGGFVGLLLGYTINYQFNP